MLRIDTRHGGGVEIFTRTDHSRLSAITLGPGERSGGPDHRHEGGDRWMIVLSGRGEAIVNEQRFLLRRGVMLLIERGEAHEIRASSGGPLRALHVDARRPR